MTEEYLEEIDSEGNRLDKPVLRRKAHRHGIWHMSVSIIVVNQHGEILMERRSEHKDLFPGYYDIPGGHLSQGMTPIDTARKEISEELGLAADNIRFIPLSDVNALIERVIIPAKSIVNLERKTAYLLVITDKEESEIIARAAEWSRQSPDVLKSREQYGEVSSIEFWHWEKLYRALSPKSTVRLASGTRSVFAAEVVRDKVARKCRELRSTWRRQFTATFLSSLLTKAESIEINRERSDGLERSIETPMQASELDRWLRSTFSETPSIPAEASEVDRIFIAGTSQLAGAYRIDRLRQRLAGTDFGEAKLNDPGHRYVQNLIKAMTFGQNEKTRKLLLDHVSQVESFVSRLLEFPLSDGSRFRDSFGNLVDISVARKAVLVWLENITEFSSAEFLAYPTGVVSRECLRSGRKLLDLCYKDSPTDSFARLQKLVCYGLYASKADFNNLKFQEELRRKGQGASVKFIESDIELVTLEESLGGIQFLTEFFSQFVTGSPKVSVAYLPGTALQSSISLAIAMELLQQNPNAQIRFIPKSGHPGNDLSYDDTIALLQWQSEGRLKALDRFAGENRFAVIDQGPATHGLDPCSLSQKTAETLGEADVILAEGQAYAEIRGWNKPVYVAFRVNGRVAEAIHGLPKESGACGFVRLTPGIDHFQGFPPRFSEMRSSGTIRSTQTTTQYVQAVLHSNLQLIVEKVFREDANEAYRQIQAEAERLDKTFAEVVLGTLANRPDEAALNEFKKRSFPIFACGGGGGFSAVTLRALSKLKKATVAGVPSTDDGGSTGKLQKDLRRSRGFVFGVGDMAAILEGAVDNKGKQALLSYRFPEEPPSLVQAVIERVRHEIATPTFEGEPNGEAKPIGSADDFLSFVCDQLNLARVIDERFRSNQVNKLPVIGASIRNLNVIAAFEYCDALGDKKDVPDDNYNAALLVLERALALPPTVLAIPVTYDQCVLYLDYADKIPDRLRPKGARIGSDADGRDGHRLYGQQFIDKLPHDGRRTMVGVEGEHRLPKANREYLRRMSQAKVIVMGAGSLVSSQLSQLAIPGVVDELLKAQKRRRILVLNHVKMDETRGMSVRDQVELIEKVADRVASPTVKNGIVGNDERLRISDLFTDVVVPRTVAREIEAMMDAEASTWDGPTSKKSQFLELPKSEGGREESIYRNRYVDFVEQNRKASGALGLTRRELEVLSYLEQPQSRNSGRREMGRYRGALFAKREDFEYLIEQGIQRRSIHEVDSIGNNRKIVKSEGESSIEEFPGLVPEALMGIFTIALERGV